MALECTHALTHTHKHIRTYIYRQLVFPSYQIAHCFLLGPYIDILILVGVYHAKVLIFAQRASTLVSHVLFLSFGLRLPAQWLTGYGYAFERFKFHIATASHHLLSLPIFSCRLFAHTHTHIATFFKLNNLAQDLSPKTMYVATCNYVAKRNEVTRTPT